MSGTVLVGVDGTEPSRVALLWSARRAGRVGSALKLVYVIDDEWATVGVRIREDLQDDARRLVEKEANHARLIEPELAVETQVLRGDVMRELIEASSTAEMVVVGTHKTGFISGKVFGSRSLLLAAAAHSPVAVIPQTSRRDGRGVVVGVDDSAAGQRAIRFAAEEAQRTRETLTLIRAYVVHSLPEGPDDTHREVVRGIEARTAAMLSDAAALAGSVAPSIEVRTRSVPRPPAEVLVKASASAALLVIGGRAGEVLGSVGHDVLINLSGPVVVMDGSDQSNIV